MSLRLLYRLGLTNLSADQVDTYDNSVGVSPLIYLVNLRILHTIGLTNLSSRQVQAFEKHRRDVLANARYRGARSLLDRSLRFALGEPRPRLSQRLSAHFRMMTRLGRSAVPPGPRREKVRAERAALRRSADDMVRWLYVVQDILCLFACHLDKESDHVTGEVGLVRRGVLALHRGMARHWVLNDMKREDLLHVVTEMQCQLRDSKHVVVHRLEVAIAASPDGRMLTGAMTNRLVSVLNTAFDGIEAELQTMECLLSDDQ